MKLCKDCKHLEREMWCKSPHLGTCPVSGESNTRFAAFERKEGLFDKVFGKDTCGLDAKWFEQKVVDQKGKRWYHFWK